VHDKLREIAYERIPAGARRPLHRAAAEAIERRTSQESERPHAALGRHWEQAGDINRARECYLAGARLATDRFALDEGQRLYRAYQRLVQEPTEQSIAARNELGENILGTRGQYDEALLEHERAQDEARRIGAMALEARSLRGSGRIHWSSGRTEETWR